MSAVERAIRDHMAACPCYGPSSLAEVCQRLIDEAVAAERERACKEHDELLTAAREMLRSLKFEGAAGRTLAERGYANAIERWSAALAGESLNG